MPIIKSAKKRVRTAEKAAIRNSKTKRSLKTALKAFRSVVTGGGKTAETHSQAQSAIDTAAKKGLVHKNKAARQKAQLARLSKDAAKVASTEAPVKKAAVKKPAVAKKAPAAKVAKAPSKKPTAAAKKPAAKK